MASSTKIKLASRAYDGVLPILRGQMGIPGFEFEITETEDVPGMFSGMFRGQYDVSEMSLGELIHYTSRDEADLIAIPVFPSRIFRHGFIFIRKNSGINRTADLSGKKIGFLRWVQTASIWMHGMLIDEYGVSAKETEWYVASMHHWDEHDPGATIKPRDGSVIRLMQNSGRDTSERACRALFDGQLDALGVTESRLPTLLADISVKKLFENSREVEASYFRKTKILPIMHVMALQKRLVEKFPELPEKLFRLYAEAKRSAQHWRRAIPSLVEAWPNYYLADEQEIFQTDPWAYGLEANRHVLDKFLEYCHAQGITARSIAPEEIFHPSTLELTE
ncbi:MAG TPA: PhnD/SsuA/transferrin family substrate-binding protein [Candidatus Binatia bacterium]|jgi:4,5-dihydroxyphthalate decarboxylase|nr:PhnD/SsuA/transferrin family substrate-binding protein [Candidatus Binatia bacterium]